MPMPLTRPASHEVMFQGASCFSLLQRWNYQFIGTQPGLLSGSKIVAGRRLLDGSKLLLVIQRLGHRRLPEKKNKTQTTQDMGVSKNGGFSPQIIQI